jgi:pimeloyl-ACP methyl ester carboxylesterase
MSDTARRGLTRYDAPPEAREPRVPRGLVGFTGEWRTVLLPARLLLRSPRLAGAPRGDGRPTILLPGWRAPELSMTPLGLYLRRLGHDTRGWGLGVNQGNPERDVALMTEVVTALHAGTGRAVALVGWSLGGLVARETARAVPEAVSHVVTFGTPVVGGPSFTIGAGAYGEVQSRRIRERAEALDRADPIRVPVTAIFTRRDNVVDWPACLDRTTAGARHVEVRSTHLGMGLDPDVWQTVADALGARP